ncbi:hypothetical protein [uncultured Sphingomonas sp.]|uniref:hypothetical protein n=1 Tax=uncultured Sphingomonas sp. TaxID=158754 RepID=UPI0035C976C1
MISLAPFALFLVAAPQAAPAALPAAIPTPATCVAPAPPADLVAWSNPLPVANATMPVGSAAIVPLTPVSAIAFPTAPARTPKPGSYGIATGFTIARAGRYRIALGGGAWIDVISGGRPLTSVAHGEGPACSGIRKIVDFDLAAGTYGLQLSGATSDKLTVLIAGS